MKSSHSIIPILLASGLGLGACAQFTDATDDESTAVNIVSWEPQRQDIGPYYGNDSTFYLTALRGVMR